MTSVVHFTEPRPAPPATFSLRTLFLILTSSGVFFAVMRVGNGILAASASLAFLWVWWLLTGQQQLARYAAIAALFTMPLLVLFAPDTRYGDGHKCNARTT